MHIMDRTEIDFNRVVDWCKFIEQQGVFPVVFYLQ